MPTASLKNKKYLNLLLSLALLFVCAGVQASSLDESQIKDIKALVSKDIETQAKEISKKVTIELLKVDRIHPKKYFSFLGDARKSISEVTELEGLYGKAVCAFEGKNRIYLSEDAPPSTLIHEYMHILQMKGNKRWCELEKATLTADEKKERAILFHRFEFDVLKALWDERENISWLTFEDRIIFIEGLNRENKILKAARLEGLDEVTAQSLQGQIDAIRAQIELIGWLRKTPEDGGAVLQKMEVISLKSCAEQSIGNDYLKRLNKCLEKRCSLGGFKCKPVSESDRHNYSDDFSLTVFAWTKPFTDNSRCSVQKLKDEIADGPEVSTKCWKEWYGRRQNKNNDFKLKTLKPKEILKHYAAPSLKDDKEFTFFEIKRPENFLNQMYCYFIYQKNVSYENLPPTQFAHSVQGASATGASLNSYKKWLKENTSGQFCAKLMKSFTGLTPQLEEYKDSQKIIFMNPVALLTAGLSKFDLTAAQALNHERLHHAYALSAKVKERTQKLWETLSEKEKESFKSAHTSYDFSNPEILLREFFAYRFQDDPTVYEGWK